MLAQAKQALESGNLSHKQKDLIAAQVSNLMAQKENYEAITQHSALDLTRAEKERDFYSRGGEIVPWLNFIKRLLK